MRVLCLFLVVLSCACAPAAPPAASAASGEQAPEGPLGVGQDGKANPPNESRDTHLAQATGPDRTSEVPADCENSLSPRNADRDSDGIGDSCDSEESYSRFEVRGDTKSSVTRGYWHNYTPRESKFGVRFPFGKRNKIALSVQSPEGKWELVLSAADALKEGAYEVDGYPSRDAPGLQLTHAGRVVSQVEGWFRIDRLQVDEDGTIQSFEGEYEFRPSRHVYREFGRFQYKSPSPLPGWGVDLARDGEGLDLTHRLSVSVVPKNASAAGLRKNVVHTAATHKISVEGGGNRAEVRFRGDASYWLDLRAPIGRRLVPGIYKSERRRSSNLLAQFDVGGVHKDCRDPTEVHVHDVVTDPTGKLVGLSASTQVECLNDTYVTLALEYGARNVVPPDVDFDDDGIDDGQDNCVLSKNGDQADADKDGIGDECDPHVDHVSIVLESDEGDVVGKGEKAEIYLRDARFAVKTTRDDRSAVGVYISLGDYSYRYEFQVASGQIRPGTFRNATRYPFNRTRNRPRTHGLYADWHGPGCNALSGNFTVHDIAFSKQGRVERFSADFEQHCESAKPALRGKIRYNVESKK